MTENDRNAEIVNLLERFHPSTLAGIRAMMDLEATRETLRCLWEDTKDGNWVGPFRDEVQAAIADGEVDR